MKHWRGDFPVREDRFKIHFTRESVAMGDDIDAPHEAHWFFHAEYATMYELCFKLAERVGQELPLIQGGHATWALHSFSSTPLAIMAQQRRWKEPRMLIMLSEQDRSLLHREDDEIRLHAVYHAQIDPDTVFEVAQRLQSGFRR